MSNDQDHKKTLSSSNHTRTKHNSLLVYRGFLNVIITILIYIMIITLIGAVVGLIIDLFSAAEALRGGVKSHKLATGFVDTIDRDLVVDVLSVFVLIELFRTFTDYLEFHRVRLGILTEVGIAFVLREIFIGLYDHTADWTDILALSLLLAVLVCARIAAISFPPKEIRQS